MKKTLLYESRKYDQLKKKLHITILHINSTVFFETIAASSLLNTGGNSDGEHKHLYGSQSRLKPPLW